MYNCVLTCYQDEYAAVSGPAGRESDVTVRCEYSVSQPLPANGPAAPCHARLQRPLHNTAELSSSLPYALNSPLPPHRLQLHHQHAGRLLQHSHSLPSSPHKLHPQLSGQSSNIYHTGSFGDMSCNMVEKTTNRSKILPKEVN